MDSQSEDFSEVEEISDFSSNSTLIDSGQYLYELEDCLKFVSILNKSFELRKLLQTRDEEEEVKDLFEKKRLTFGMKSENAEVLKGKDICFSEFRKVFSQQKENARESVQSFNDAALSNSKSIEAKIKVQLPVSPKEFEQENSSFLYFQRNPGMSCEQQQTMNACLKLKDLNLTEGSLNSRQSISTEQGENPKIKTNPTCNKPKSSQEEVLINNLKLDVNKLQQKYYNQLPNSMRKQYSDLGMK